jgi:hypothetical protein
MKSEKFCVCILLFVFLFVTSVSHASAAKVPTGFTDATVASGLNNPTAGSFDY